MATTYYNALNADSYESFMGRWSKVLAPKFLAFSGLSPGERVLDVGCGTGSLTAAIADAVSVQSVDGIDLAEPYLAKARATCTDPRIQFHKGDAASLPFTDGSFDRVLSQLVLHFVPDAEAAISEMTRVVRPGGVVAAAVWDTYGGTPAHRYFWDTAAMLDAKVEAARSAFFFRPMTAPGDLDRAWRNAGLREVVQSELVVRMNYADFNDFWWPIAAGEGGLGKHMLSLAPANARALEEAVKRAYLAGRGDGSRSFAAVAWVCRGIK